MVHTRANSKASVNQLREPVEENRISPEDTEIPATPMSEKKGRGEKPPGGPSAVGNVGDEAAATTSDFQTPGNSTIHNRFEKKKIFFSTPKPPNTTQTTTNCAKSAPPPFNVFGESAETSSKNLLNENNIKFVIKHLSHCIQIYVNNNDDFNKASSLLQAHNCHFYTYPTAPAKNTNKFVLHGLGDFDIADILDDLQEYGLKAAEVKKIQPTKPRFAGQHIYIIHFDIADGVTLPLLRKAKYVGNTVVEWQHYKSQPGTYKTCRNCYRTSHGTSTCFLPPVCMFCAKEHKSVDCELLIQKRAMGKDSIPSHLLCCAMCKGHHTAGHPSCPRVQQHIAKKQSNSTRPTQYQPATTPSVNSWAVPATTLFAPKPAQQQRTPQQSTPRSSQGPADQPNMASTSHHQSVTPRRRRRSPQIKQVHFQRAVNEAEYNKISSPVTSSINYNRNPSPMLNPQWTNNNIQSFSHDLFTPDQTVEIFKDMVNCIRSCKNKSEQLQALMKLALKWQ